ncbi:MAG: hypothetical protein IPN49_10115 [Saprospiraceae bacterium]|nr:hypothetical protein [Saprospiraceae bacterium]
MAASKYFNANPNKFKGNGTQGGVQYSYQVISAPVITLIPNNNSKNISIALTVNIKVPTIPFDHNVSMAASAKISIVNSVLSVTNLSLSAVNPADAFVVGLINAVVIPALATSLTAIPIPLLTGVFGPSLSAQILAWCFEQSCLGNQRKNCRNQYCPKQIHLLQQILNALNSGNSSNAKS